MPEMSETRPLIAPMDCARLDTPTQGLPCVGCERLDTPEGCLALNAVIELTRRNAELERQNAELLARLLNIRVDVLVDRAYTPEGLRDYLQYNENGIQGELNEMAWGVIRLDGRFVNYINRFGNLAGDDFLRAGGARIAAISDGLARVDERRQEEAPVTTDQRIEDRRQPGQAGGPDIFCRQGGDEFSLIIRGVSRNKLRGIADRIQKQLTPEQAIERYAGGGIPFIASVGFSHATDLDAEVLESMERGDYLEAFQLVNAGADDGQRAVKTSQYEEMWQAALDKMTADQRAEWIAQPDDRVVAEQFLLHLCPSFWESPAEFVLAHQARSEEDEEG
jgi:hypothetical protein